MTPVALLLLGGAFDELVQVGGALLERLAFWGHVHVVEAVVRVAKLLEELKRGVLLGKRGFHRVGTNSQPWSVERACTEHIAARPVEAVPVANSDAKNVFHPTTHHHAVRVVHPEPQAVSGVYSGCGNWMRNVGEKGL